MRVGGTDGQAGGTPASPACTWLQVCCNSRLQATLSSRHARATLSCHVHDCLATLLISLTVMYRLLIQGNRSSHGRILIPVVGLLCSGVGDPAGMIQHACSSQQACRGQAGECWKPTSCAAVGWWQCGPATLSTQLQTGHQRSSDCHFVTAPQGVNQAHSQPEPGALTACGRWAAAASEHHSQSPLSHSQPCSHTPIPPSSSHGLIHPVVGLLVLGVGNGLRGVDGRLKVLKQAARLLLLAIHQHSVAAGEIGRMIILLGGIWGATTACCKSLATEQSSCTLHRSAMPPGADMLNKGGQLFAAPSRQACHPTCCRRRAGWRCTRGSSCRSPRREGSSGASPQSCRSWATCGAGSGAPAGRGRGGREAAVGYEASWRVLGQQGCAPQGLPLTSLPGAMRDATPTKAPCPQLAKDSAESLKSPTPPSASTHLVGVAALVGAKHDGVGRVVLQALGREGLVGGEELDVCSRVGTGTLPAGVVQQLNGVQGFACGKAACRHGFAPAQALPLARLTGAAAGQAVAQLQVILQRAGSAMRAVRRQELQPSWCNHATASRCPDPLPLRAGQTSRSTAPSTHQGPPAAPTWSTRSFAGSTGSFSTVEMP